MALPGKSCFGWTWTSPGLLLSTPLKGKTHTHTHTHSLHSTVASAFVSKIKLKSHQWRPFGAAGGVHHFNALVSLSSVVDVPSVERTLTNLAK